MFTFVTRNKNTDFATVSVRRVQCLSQDTTVQFISTQSTPLITASKTLTIKKKYTKTEKPSTKTNTLTLVKIKHVKLAHMADFVILQYKMQQ